MSRTVVFPLGNQNRSQDNMPVAAADIKAQEAFECERNKLLQITNYLEALNARLLTESAEATALKLIADEISPNPM